MIAKRLFVLSTLLIMLPIASFASVVGIGDYTYNGNGSYTIYTNEELTTTDVDLEEFLSLPGGTVDLLTSSDATFGSAIKNSLTINAGDTISFSWLWNSSEASNETTYNDFSFVTISLDGLLQEILYLADTYTADNTTGTFSWTADTSGILTYGVAITNAGDNQVSSYLTVSNVKVPEPSTLSVILLGLLLIASPLLKTKTSHPIAPKQAHQ